MKPAPKPRRSVVGLVSRLVLLLLLGLVGLAAACRLPDLRSQGVCAAADAALDDGLVWVREQGVVVRQLVQNLSSAVKDFLESTQTSKN